MLTSALYYDLPAELIAQRPIEPRDASRLMLIDRATGRITHRHFNELTQIIQPGDCLIANDSLVIPARVFGRKPTGGKVEILLLRKVDPLTWQTLVNGHNVGDIDLAISSGKTIHAQIVNDHTVTESTKLLRFSEPIELYLPALGVTPLPPYIHERISDPARYQTVYARVSGSAAAPTAGLHFTPALIQQLQQLGIAFGFVTLHIGLDTFKPVTEETLESHKIHTEWCELPAQTAKLVNSTKQKGGRVVAVGTTSARVLESSQSRAEKGSGTDVCQPFAGFTSLYITPGYTFHIVDALITNFHTPRSTLLAMIGAFMGLELLRNSYRIAIQERYRFYSFGDAMFVT